MPVPGLSLLGLKRIRGLVSILRYINPTIIIIIIKMTPGYLCHIYLVTYYLYFKLPGKYMQMMKVLKPIAFDVTLCMSQLFDFYLYAVSVTIYTPFTLQVVHPAVRGFIWQQNSVPGRLISSKI